MAKKLQPESFRSLFEANKLISPQNSIFSVQGDNQAANNNQSYDTLMQDDQHANSGSLSDDQVPLLSQELKKLRLRISDFNKSPIVDHVCQKIWRLMVLVQYNENMLELILHWSALPIDIHLYSAITPIFEQALGIYFHTNYYVAKVETFKQGQGNVFYQRFVYDLVSMFGLNLFYMDIATLEFLLRGVYRAISYRVNNKVVLKSLKDVRPAFTQQELLKVAEKMKKTTEIDVKIIENTEEQLFELDLSKYDNTQKQEELRKKRALIKQKELELKTFKPFKINDYDVKMDPVKTLQTLKRLNVNALSVVPAEQEQSTIKESTDFDSIKLESSRVIEPIENLAAVENLKNTARSNQFQAYQHMLNFNQADYNEGLDVEERYKQRQMHEQIMKKQQSRPEEIKIKKYLTYEAINLRSNLYNKKLKMDKMFTELNAIQYKPQRNEGQIIQDPSKRENSLQRLYQPKIEWSRDVFLHNLESVQQYVQEPQKSRQKSQNRTSTFLNQKANLDVNEQNQSPPLVNRWTPLTKNLIQSQDEQILDSKEKPCTLKTKSTLQDKFKPMYSNIPTQPDQKLEPQIINYEHMNSGKFQNSFLSQTNANFSNNFKGKESRNQSMNQTDLFLSGKAQKISQVDHLTIESAHNNQMFPPLKKSLDTIKQQQQNKVPNKRTRHEWSYAETTKSIQAKSKNPLYTINLHQESVSIDRFQSPRTKPQAPIAQVILGDFQLRSTRHRTVF